MKEIDFEKKAIEVLQSLGYEHLHGGDEAFQRERGNDLKKVLLESRFLSALERINPNVPKQALRDAVEELQRKIDEAYAGRTGALNKEVYELLTQGISVEVKGESGKGAKKVRCIDFQNIENNEFVVVNQMSIKVQGEERRRRPDAILFINGIPVVVFEFKDATNPTATIYSAFKQVEEYQKDISQLFATTQIIVLSDWTKALYGTNSTKFKMMSEWKKIESEDDEVDDNLETLLKGMCNKRRLLDIIQHFILFKDENNKIVCRYHQYYGVNNVFRNAEKAHESLDPEDKKLGVFWHTQGSGKTLSMVFLIKKIRERLPSTTFVFITDRNDLDDQAYKTLQQAIGDPVKNASNRKDLMRWVKEGNARVIVTTIQKFEDEGDINENHNVIVISDEAHRSQNKEQARKMRNTLPNASFLGITGTPISQDDKNTIQTFGEIVSKYTIDMSVRDGVTVSIHYELRYAELGIDPKYEKFEFLEEFFGYGDEVELGMSDRKKGEYTKFTHLLQAEERIQAIARDIVEHFSQRKDAGKGIICVSSKEHAQKMYKVLVGEIEKQKAKDIEVAVVLSDLDQIEKGKVQDMRDVKMIKSKFQKFDDPLNLVIVCDMWLTGFDMPCLSTMYIDKPLRNHTLLQAVARVNRVFGNKESGLIIDYIGLTGNLRKALSHYTEEYINESLHSVDELVVEMQRLLGEIMGLLGIDDVDQRVFSVNDFNNAYQRVAKNEDTTQNFLKKAKIFIRAYDIILPHKQARHISKQRVFIQSVIYALQKNKKRSINIDIPPSHQDIQKEVDSAVYSQEIRLLFQPGQSIDILSKEFIQNAEKAKHKDIFVDTMRALVEEKIDELWEIDEVEGKKFKEKLQKLIQQYKEGIFDMKETMQGGVLLREEVGQMLKEGVDEEGLTKKDRALLRILKQLNATGALRSNAVRAMLDEIMDIARKDMTIDWRDNDQLTARMNHNIKEHLIVHYGCNVNTAIDIAKVLVDKLAMLYEDYAPEPEKVDMGWRSKDA